MNLTDYLRERHPTINALTRAEARVIGIKYPLQKGWAVKYASLELPDEIVEKLRKARADRYSQESYQKAKAKSQRAGENKQHKPAKDKRNKQLPRETKRQKRERLDSLTRLVKTIINQGCTDAEKLARHLNRRPNQVDSARNNQHFKSI